MENPPVVSLFWFWYSLFLHICVGSRSPATLAAHLLCVFMVKHTLTVNLDVSVPVRMSRFHHLGPPAAHHYHRPFECAKCFSKTAHNACCSLSSAYNGVICCCSQSINYPFSQMSTRCQNSYRGEEIEIEITNVAPAAVYEFLEFKSWDFREPICIQVESEGEASVMEKQWSNTSMLGDVYNRCCFNMAVVLHWLYTGTDMLIQELKPR